MVTMETRRAPEKGEQHRLMAEPSAEFAPSSYDREAGTVGVIWSTGAEVRRFDWWRERYYMEGLDLAGARLERMQAGAPLLLDHWASVRNVVGSIVPGSVRVQGGRGYATLRFDRSSDDGQAAEAKVAGGHIRSVSIGYSIHATTVERGIGTQAEPDRVRVTDFEPYEISLVAVPADAGAGLRSHPASITTNSTNLTQEGRMAERNQPGSEPENSNTPPAASPAVADRAQPKGATLEEILPVAKRAGLDLSWVETMAGKPMDEVRDAAIDEISKRARPITQTATPSGDDPRVILEAMAEAVAARAMPAFKPANAKAREYMALRPSDMLMELAQARGERVSARDRDRLITRAFHTTSDFPMLLELAGNKMLETGFALAAPSYRTFFARRNFTDFKAHSFLQAGDFPALARLEEGAEITTGTISETRERITPRTFARGVAVTRQMLINDDLGAFADFGTMIGRRVADYENALAYEQVNTASGAGPTLTEGSAAVFTTGRGNRASSGGAISEANLDLAVAAIAEQTSLDGLKLNLQPRFLLTGSAYRGAALRFTTRISPEAGSNVGLYSDLDPIMDSNITGNRWYLFSDPNAAPIYVYGYVNGAEAPTIRVHDQIPGRDGVLVEVIHDFAVGAIGFRGGYFNPGA